MKKKCLLFSFMFVSIICLIFTGCSNKGDEFVFTEAEFKNEIYSVVVANNIEEYSLLDKISVNKNYKWSVAKDEYGLTTFTTKIVPLSVGDNNFYIIVLDKEENSTLYEICIRRKPLYNVFFDTKGGSSIEQQVIEEGSTIQTPENPTKEGFEFDGWSMDVFSPITSSVTFEARWLIDTYTIIFDKGLGTGEMESQIIPRNQSIKLNSNLFTKVGYSFAGWNYNNSIIENETEVFNLTLNRGEKITLIATFVPNQYKITLDVDGGNFDNGSNYVLVTMDDEFLLPIPHKENFIFGGWYTGLSQVSDKNGYSLFAFNYAENITLIAKWFSPINSITQFLAIKNNLNENYILTENLDFSQVDFIKDLGDFNGILDGNGKTINNFTGSSEIFYNNNGLIKNLIFTNTSILQASSGTLSSVISSANYGIIKTCSISGIINANESYGAIHIGGVVGSNYGDIKDCITNININANADSEVILGGIVSINHGNILNCVALGNLYGFSDSYRSVIGGIAGWGHESSSIQKSVSIGQLIAESKISTYNYLFVNEIEAKNKCFDLCYITGRDVETSSDNRRKSINQLSDLTEFFNWLYENFDTNIWNINNNSLPALKFDS